MVKILKIKSRVIKTYVPTNKNCNNNKSTS